MSKFVDQLIKMRPELQRLGLRRYIGEGLADNCSKGLNGKYAIRLREGIRAATTAEADQLVGIIQGLLDDRRKYGCDDRFEIPAEEESRRVLILALWTNRPVHLGRNGVWQAGKNACYGDETYMPSLKANQSSSTHATEAAYESPCYQPTVTDWNQAVALLSQDGSRVKFADVFNKIEQDCEGTTLCPGWKENLKDTLKRRDESIRTE